MRKPNARTVVMNTGDLMLRDLKTKLNEHKKYPNCKFLSKKKEEMGYHVVKKHACSSPKQ